MAVDRLTDRELAELRRLATTVQPHVVQYDPEAIVALVDEVRDRRRDEKRKEVNLHESAT